jgi:3-dehydroquinate synthase
MQTVRVELGERSYPIHIGGGILGAVGGRLRDLRFARTAAVITNAVVGPLYLPKVESSLREAGFAPTTIELPDGEEHKNLAWLTLIYDRMIDAGMERNSPVIALGGGVVGDMAGFAASTFLRGLPYVQLPTTLLAQVDSSVGGKTGVNHVAGKNLIGTFYQPRFVLVDTQTLKTLPRREFAAGLAEVIKYGVILDPDLFALVERELKAIIALDEAVLTEVIRVCCTLKAMVVGEDERETDYRAILNFGHTVGHAIEALTEYKRYLHGEAVAIGMAFAARVSHGRGTCGAEVVERIVHLLRRAQLPVDMPKDVSGRPLALAIRADKKAAGDKIRFVGIDDIGQTRFDFLSAEEIASFAGR